MALLDGDRFEGRFRDGVHAMDVDGLMRRMVKEELLTFEGKPLFRERRAQSVPYELSALERELYEAVTQYVREEMNRADQLKAAREGRRSNTVGFALTVLQRRLASSPEAIWRSLERRRQRLERRRQEMTQSAVEVSLASRLDDLLARSAVQVEDMLATTWKTSTPPSGKHSKRTWSTPPPLPGRIEQRFGHRIGQTEVCHLWNLVAVSTREGQVYARLLEKVEEQRRSYGSGKVFDVLGEAFTVIPLRDLLVRAIRYGEQPEVRAHLDQVVDASVGAGIDKLMAERALATDTMNSADVSEIRLAMEAARARRLQPHYIRAFFAEAFARLGGVMRPREPERFEITHVPVVVQQRDRAVGPSAPVLARYERVTFEREHVDCPGKPRAELVAPGHPLLDAVIAVVIERHGAALKHGTVLVDAGEHRAEPRLLVAIAQEIVDGHTPPLTVSKRFDFVEITPTGSARPCGPAPYLDYDPIDEHPHLDPEAALTAPWLTQGPDEVATVWAVTHEVAAHRTETAARIGAQVAKTRAQVDSRLTDEIQYWDARALD